MIDWIILAVEVILLAWCVWYDVLHTNIWGNRK